MKSVLITGASRGIGLEFVRQMMLKSSLTHIFAGCRSPDGAKDLKALADKDKRVHIIILDVVDDANIAAAAKHVHTIVGDAGLNVLINNAGVLPRQQEFGMANRRTMAETYDINTIGPIMCAQTLHPLLRTAAAANADKPMGAARALIFNMSTGLASIEGNDNGSKLIGLAYRCSKTALNMASKCMAIDLKADNIVTIAVLPGYVTTDMNMHYYHHDHHHQGAITAEESVRAMVSLIDSVNETHNGRFMTRTGEDYKW